jgi:hypothetical protein
MPGRQAVMLWKQAASKAAYTKKEVVYYDCTRQ